MAQVTSVTSESLQAEFRRLLPSQQGFGEDLQASNVILPIIDLTSTASGSDLGVNLQTASGLTNTHFRLNAEVQTVLTGNTGFFLFNYVFLGQKPGSANVLANISVTDGTTTTIIREMISTGSLGANNQFQVNDDVVIYLNAGESVKITATGAYTHVSGSYRQIATSTGTLVNPTGFSSE